MRINPIQFNFVQHKPQNTVSSPLRINNSVQADTVSFTGKAEKKISKEKMGKLVPKHKGIIYRKLQDAEGAVVKVPVLVDIVKSEPEEFEFKIDGRRIGYARLSYIPKKYCKDEIKDAYVDCYYKNYEDLGITGDRIKVNYVENEKEYLYGGIGHLADLLEVACCQKLGFKPNVISSSVNDAAPIHYLRGKRFVPYEEYCDEAEMKGYDLYGKNPNDTMEEIIENASSGYEFDTSKIQNEPLMYMPEEMIAELEEELKDHPIF
ncbi:hypothetical protein IJI31_02945 [bacterium]|nr:hypothetical protein [bacterium]